MTPLVIIKTITSDTTTRSITYECHSDYRNIFIIQPQNFKTTELMHLQRFFKMVLFIVQCPKNVFLLIKTKVFVVINSLQ
jgi:hypothetical protein